MKLFVWSEKSDFGTRVKYLVVAQDVERARQIVRFDTRFPCSQMPAEYYEKNPDVEKGFYSSADEAVLARDPIIVEFKQEACFTIPYTE